MAVPSVTVVGACMLGWGASKLFVFRQGSALAVKSFCALNVVPMLLLTLNQAKRDGCAGLLFHLQAPRRSKKCRGSVVEGTA